MRRKGEAALGPAPGCHRGFGEPGLPAVLPQASGLCGLGAGGGSAGLRGPGGLGATMWGGGSMEDVQTMLA